MAFRLLAVSVGLLGVGLLALGFWHWAFHVPLLALGFWCLAFAVGLLALVFWHCAFGVCHVLATLYKNNIYAHVIDATQNIYNPYSTNSHLLSTQTTLYVLACSCS